MTIIGKEVHKMSIYLECKKMKRTGFVPAFLAGGILAAAVPVVNMSVRHELYRTKHGSPVQILFDANWQTMAMLNVLLVVLGSCMLYHMEYADNAMQKMKSLPIRAGSLFFGKAILTVVMSFFVLAMEAAAVAFCSSRWFETGNGFYTELSRTFGYAFLLMLPCILLSLLVSEACKNMWVSLGIGVVCVFTATMLPSGSFFLSLFPFAMPFRTSADTAHTARLLLGAAAEAVIFALAHPLLIKVRRLSE